MLNRFQFARLRAFRRGKGRPAQVEDRGHDRRDEDAAVGVGVEAASQKAPEDRAPASEEVRDGWSDDERVARLLERRQAAQEAERRAAIDRLGAPQTANGGRLPESPAPERPAPAARTVTRTVNPDGTVDVDVHPAARPGGAAPGARRTDDRTRTVPAARPAPPRASAPAVDEAPLAGRGAPREAAGSVAAAVPAPTATQTARVVCIASGKGGTGKSVLATNLAVLRAKQGERVLLVDFDAGLANAHLLLGLAPPYDVGHVMEGEVSARSALVDGPHGVKLLSGGVGRQTMIDPTRRELDRLFKALRPLEDEFDLILIDHGAGLSYSTVAHLAATSTLILVTNHEVTALSDGYALYKRAHMVNRSIRVGLVVNRAPDERIAMDAWDRFRGASHKFLGHAPEWIGWVPADPAVPQAVQMRTPAVISYPDSSAAVSLQRVASWPPIEHARTTVPFYEKARRALR